MCLIFAKEKARMSRPKKRKYEKEEISRLSKALIENGRAVDVGQKRKHWTKHDIKNITPLTPTQDEMFHAFFNNFHICAHGSAGTGKTFIALYLAFSEILRHESPIDHIIIVRSAVSTRDVGFVPGTLEEKTALYELPYDDMCGSLFGRMSTYRDMKEAGIIRFLSTSFVRGLTWDNAVVIIDEFQNMTLPEVDSVITRVGQNTRVILCGDANHQCDLKKEKTCAKDVVNILSHMKDFALITFTKDDIVRSQFVKNWILARDDTNI